MGDFNARVGRDTLSWGKVIGKHGVGKSNSNRLLLLSLCCEFDLVITKTIFQQSNSFKTTWWHLGSRYDYIIVRDHDRRDINSTAHNWSILVRPQNYSLTYHNAYKETCSKQSSKTTKKGRCNKTKGQEYLRLFPNYV